MLTHDGHVGILIVINKGVVWGRANGAVWGSRKVRRKGCIRAMGDVPLDPRFGRGVAFRYGQAATEGRRHASRRDSTPRAGTYYNQTRLVAMVCHNYVLLAPAMT